MEAEGHAVHGEADFLDPLPGGLVLDAGCGAGRVAAELARRGRQVVGVDNDAEMLEYARQKPEPVRWVLGNLADVQVGEPFDIILLAGNILNYVEPSLRADAVTNLSKHLLPDGLLVCGATEVEACSFDDVDRWCEAAGLSKVEQFGTWDREPFDGTGYRVGVFTPA
jgi:SAM-dependent methyltransferase